MTRIDGKILRVFNNYKKSKSNDMGQCRKYIALFISIEIYCAIAHHSLAMSNGSRSCATIAQLRSCASAVLVEPPFIELKW